MSRLVYAPSTKPKRRSSDAARRWVRTMISIEKIEPSFTVITVDFDGEKLTSGPVHIASAKRLRLALRQALAAELDAFAEFRIKARRAHEGA